LNGTTLEDRCKIYNNTCKLKCSAFTESETCQSDDCFWLYSESEGERGNCEEKDDDLLTCSDVKRSYQCPLSGISKLENNKCIWVLDMCYDVKDTCKSVINKDICESEGVARGTNGILNCLWLKENTTRNVSGKCENQVRLKDIICSY
jgi:hypothetical protein